MTAVAAAARRYWTPKRQRVYPRLVLVLCVFWSTAFFLWAWTVAARDNRQYGSDFMVYYAAGKLALEGHADEAYDVELQHRAEQNAVGEVGRFPYYYPPPFQFVLAPMAALPYSLALAVWLFGSLVALGVVVRKILWPWGAWFLLAAFVPLLVGLGFGQNGLLTAALLGGGLLLVERKPAAAGVLFGLLSFKPQFLIAGVVGLVVGRRWQVLAWAGGSAAAVAAASLLVFGPDPWRGFFDSLGDASDALYQRQGSEKMPGILAAGVTLGLPDILSQTLHAAVAIPALILVARNWPGTANTDLRNGITALATPLISPYAFVYDLPVLVLAAAWLLRSTRNGTPLIPAEKVVAGVAVTAPLWCWLLAEATSLQLGWLALMGLLAVLAYRAERAAALTPA